MRLILTAITVLTTAACSPGTPLTSDILIPKDKVEQVSKFTLQCIENALGGDEDPDDLVYACQHVAKQLYGETHYYVVNNMSHFCVSTKPELTMECWKRVQNL